MTGPEPRTRFSLRGALIAIVVVVIADQIGRVIGWGHEPGDVIFGFFIGMWWQGSPEPVR